MRKIILASLITMSSIVAYASEYEPNFNTRTIKPQEFGSQVFFTKTNTEEQMDIFFNNGKYYLAGKKGDSYTINICNNRYNKYGHNSRTLFVVSVDGLNVISGEPAAYKQSGYVISPNSCNKIKGWRKNMNEEAMFFLTSADNSYSSKTNNGTSNVGVIGIAMFNEYQEPSRPIISYENSQKLNGMADSARSASAGAGLSSPAPSSMEEMSARKSESIGTGHGERVTSQATSTEFKRASDKPYKVISFYYDTYDNLLEKGIIKKKYQGPQAFPTETKFAPDPMR
jgi:hypothetical protein